MDFKAVQTPGAPHVRWAVFGFAMALLVILVGATGWWIGSGDTDIAEAAPPAEIQALLDDFYAAFAAYDGDAMAQLITEDFRMSTEWTPPLRAQDFVRRINMGETLKWTLEPVSEPIMIGDTAEPSFPLDGAYVTSVDRMAGTGISGGAGFSTFFIVIEDGVPKVASYEFPLRGYLAENEWWFEQ